MAGLPTQPERQGGMSDCSRLPVCCAMASAQGATGLCCAWPGPGLPRGVASGCWELGWEAPSLHVTVQSHPEGLPQNPTRTELLGPRRRGAQPADGHSAPPPKL